MEETDKIWMNGELVDWADAKVHVGVHGLHYGTGVFEGIRCYETPKGPAVFRLADHMQRLHDSARLLYMELPYTVEELREATHEPRARERAPGCYIRPIAFYGYGQLGVSTQGNPVETVIMSWPWGAYLGEEALDKGITACISSWKRVGPNTIPHASKASGVYLNSMLATTEARRAGYDEGDPAHRRRLRRRRARREHLRRQGRRDPDAAALHLDPARDHPRRRDHDRAGPGLRRRGGAADPLRPLPRGRVLHDRNRGRGDAGARRRRPGARRRARDEGDPGRLPGHRQRPHRPLVALARRRRRRAGRAPPRERRPAGDRPLSPWLDEREEELVLDVMRSGRLSLGPWIDRFEEEFAAAVGAPYAAAVSSGTAGLHLLCVDRGHPARRRGDHVAVLVRRLGELRHLRGRAPVFADIDPRTLNLDPAAVEAAITPRTRAIVAVDIFGYPSEMDELQAIASKNGIALIDDSCEALGARYKGRPLGAQGQDAVFAFYPNKQITTGEGGDRHDPLRGDVAAAEEPSQPGPRRRRRLARPRPARLQLPHRRHPRPRSASASSRSSTQILAARVRGRRALRRALADVEGLGLPCPDDADHERSWFVYVVELPRAPTARR